MATQNSKKSKKAPATKAKPSKAASSRKPAAKAPGKAKAPVKAKTVTKAKPAGKAKKAVAVKSKPVSKSVKPAAAKAKPKAAAAKPKAAAKKTAVKPQVKSVKTQPVASKPAPIVKAEKAPKSGAMTHSSKPAKKPEAPKVIPALKATPPPQKSAALTQGSKTTSVEKQLIKPAETLPAKPKPTLPDIGSKATDLTKKPTVSTNPDVPRAPQGVIKAKAPITPVTHSKSMGDSKPKPTEKMIEKRDVKPATMMGTPEEPQKTRFSDKELEEFDILIDQKLIIAREQLEFYLKQLEDMAENPDNKIKGLDDGLSSLESERISSLASRQQKLIQHLENAKIRIKNKVYGICRETGKLISKERLRAVPHATLSIEAKQAQN